MIRILDEPRLLIAFHVVAPKPEGMIWHALSVGLHRTPPVRGLVRPLGRINSSNWLVATGVGGAGLGMEGSGQIGGEACCSEIWLTSLSSSARPSWLFFGAS